jgi:hypothetical protein
MATTEQLESALRKADAAGNTEDAKALAAELRRMRSQAPSEIPQRRGIVEDIAGELTRAAVPYVAATGVGAALGGPFGAAAAPLALAGGDVLVGGVYNPIARLTGLPTAPTPSESFQSVAERLGIGARGQTSTARTLGAITQGALGGGTSALASRALAGNQLTAATGGRELLRGVAGPILIPETTAPVAIPAVTRNVLQQMATQPRMQVAAGSAGSGVPQIAQEMGVTDPAALAATGTVAGLGAARLTAPKPPPRAVQQEALQAQVDDAYARIDKAGVSFKPDAVSSLATNVRQALESNRFNAVRHPQLATALAELESVANDAVKRGTPLTVKDIDVLRGVVKGAAGSAKQQESKLAMGAAQIIDDFVDKLVPKNVSANLKEARALNTKLSRSKEIQKRIDRASLSGAEPAVALRREFKSLANSRLIRTFEPEQRNVIRGIAKGNKVQNSLLTLAKLEPSLNLRGLAAGSVATALGMTVNPYIGGALAATGVASRAISNRLAEQQANRAAAMMRGGPYVRDWRGQPIPEAILPVASTALPQ